MRAIHAFQRGETPCGLKIAIRFPYLANRTSNERNYTLYKKNRPNASSALNNESIGDQIPWIFSGFSYSPKQFISLIFYYSGRKRFPLPLRDTVCTLDESGSRFRYGITVCTLDESGSRFRYGTTVCTLDESGSRFRYGITVCTLDESGSRFRYGTTVCTLVESGSRFRYGILYALWTKAVPASATGQLYALWTKAVPGSATG